MIPSEIQNAGCTRTEHWGNPAEGYQKMDKNRCGYFLCFSTAGNLSSIVF